MYLFTFFLGPFLNVESFHVGPQPQHFQQRRLSIDRMQKRNHPFTTSTLFQSILNDNTDEEQEWINPFEQSKTLSKKSRAFTAPDVSNISIRKMKMKEMTSRLLSSSPDKEEMRLILKENYNLVMAPFIDEDFDPKLDPESIYTDDMDTPSLRFEHYVKVMEGRIIQAQSAVAQNVLQAMLDFVGDNFESEDIEVVE